MSFSAGPPLPPLLPRTTVAAAARQPLPPPSSSSTSPFSSSSTSSLTTSPALLAKAPATWILPTSKKEYGHILTHQEKKRQRMPKRKAESWPTNILTDPDVLSLDDEGRFVLCKVCHVHYAVHGGKKPKPVIMNSSFRTRAWEVHKERTNSHRLHKRPNDQIRQRRSESGERKESEKPPSPETVSQQHSSSSGSTLAAATTSSGRSTLPKCRDTTEQHFPTPPPTAAAPLAPSQAAMPGPTEYPKESSPRRRIFRPTPTHPGSRQWPMSHEEHARRREPLRERAPLAMASATDRQPSDSQRVNPDMDGLLRWRNMHEDVSRALGSMRKRPPPDHYGDSPGLPTETEDFSGNNEKVAKKLKSLNEEYDAKALKRPDVYYDRRSDAYKQYWGTMRDVYTQGSTWPAGSRDAAPKGNALPSLHRPVEPVYAKESPEDSTTPDDADDMDEFLGSSEDPAKPVMMHDQTLVNAIDRLTGVISKQFSDRYAKETTLMLESVGKLTQAVDDLRVHQHQLLDRLLHVEEQKLHVMEAMLQHQLHKKLPSHPPMHPPPPNSL